MNKYDIMEIESQARKEIKKTKEPPSIEKISEKEVYLLDNERRRIKKICGYIEDGWPCTSKSGQGTLHEGEGHCRKHDYYNAGERGFTERLIQTISTDNDLTKYLDEINSADYDLYDIDRYIKLVDAFLTMHINNNKSLSGKELSRIMSMLEQNRRFIETHMKKEKNRILAQGIAAWVKSVLQIIINNTSFDLYSKIQSQILSIELPEEITDIEFEENK